MKMIRTRKQSLGRALHTALRKCCDSNPTSIAWNLINLESFNPAWDAYLVEAEKALKPRSVNKNNSWAALKAASNEMDYGTSEKNALAIAFKMFDEGDWKGMASFLGEWA